MAKIKTVVDAMDLSDLQPEPPEPAEAPPAPELTEIQIEDVVKKMQKPWIYGTALHRFAKKEGIPFGQIKKIRKAIDDRLLAEAAAAIPDPE